MNEKHQKKTRITSKIKVLAPKTSKKTRMTSKVKVLASNASKKTIVNNNYNLELMITVDN